MVDSPDGRARTMMSGWRTACIQRALMSPVVEVRFRGLVHDPSVESAIHRWVARFESMRIEVQHVRVTLEPSRRRRTMVSLTLELTDGTAHASTTIHGDVYVGVADAFRTLRQELLRVTPPMRTRYAAFS